MTYNLLILDRENKKETLLTGFGNEKKVIDFCNKNCEDFKGFDMYATAYGTDFKQNTGKSLNVDLILQKII